MAHTLHDLGVVSQIDSYSDAIEVKPNSRWLITSGTPDLTTMEMLCPKILPVRPNSRGRMLSAS
jgi:hypothetical protein